MKNLYVISGCNCADKTTESYTILPKLLNCKEFVNTYEIVRGLSPFNPDKVAIKAGRLMISIRAELKISGEDFAFETTLSTRSYVNTVNKVKEYGYFVTIIYFL